MTGTETIKLVSLDGTPHWRMPDGSFRPANPETGSCIARMPRDGRNRILVIHNEREARAAFCIPNGRPNDGRGHTGFVRRTGFPVRLFFFPA